MRFVVTTVRGVALAVAFGGAAFAMERPDAWITTKAKIALLTTEGVHGTAVDVDTVNGRVTLHGKVRSDAEKERAATAVRKIEGVRDVRDLLVVVPAAREDAVKESDADIKDRVTQALKSDPGLQGSSVAVQSVNQGVVLLSGKAKTLSAHLRAVEVAAEVPGVRRVASEIESPNSLGDAEIYEDTPGAVAAAGDTVTDAWLTSATKLHLVADSRTPSMDINVDTSKGVVTLFGIVPSQEAKQAAEEDARGVSGVAGVRNELQVVPSERQAAVEERDDDIEQNVQRAIDGHDDLRSLGIGIEVKNGVVRLSGTVPSQGERLAAAVTARGAAGVRSVRDDLEVKGTAVTN